jgi:thiamine pyrophosphate-dependent acetolactate synthase large subunit-like protein
MIQKLFFLLLGCKPQGRNTEQHDVLFAIGHSLKELVPQINNFWPSAGKIHIDGWKEINTIDNYSIKVVEGSRRSTNAAEKLFFINLGGYKENELEEFHYKMLTVAADKSEAIKKAMQTAFYKHTGFKNANSHIDDKYGVDVDDIYEIEDIISDEIKNKFHLQIEKINGTVPAEDSINLGYFKLSAL